MKTLAWNVAPFAVEARPWIASSPLKFGGIARRVAAMVFDVLRGFLDRGDRARKSSTRSPAHSPKISGAISSDRRARYHRSALENTYIVFTSDNGFHLG